jgi:hypothetical protein
MANGFPLILLLADTWMASIQPVSIHRKIIEQLYGMTPNKLIPRLGENTIWCLVESQNWVGADVYQVDCDANPSDPSCLNNGTGIDPASERMANLYSNDVVCWQSVCRPTIT